MESLYPDLGFKAFYMFVDGTTEEVTLDKIGLKNDLYRNYIDHQELENKNN